MPRVACRRLLLQCLLAAGLAGHQTARLITVDLAVQLPVHHNGLLAGFTSLITAGRFHSGYFFVLGNLYSFCIVPTVGSTCELRIFVVVD